MSFGTWVGEDGDVSWNMNDQPAEDTSSTQIYDDYGNDMGSHTVVVDEDGDITSPEFNVPTQPPEDPDHTPSQAPLIEASKWELALSKILYALIDWPIETVSKRLNIEPITFARWMTLIGAGGLGAWGVWRFAVGIPFEFLEYGALGAVFLFVDGSVYLLRQMCFCEYLGTFAIVPILGSVVTFFCDVAGNILRNLYTLLSGIFEFLEAPSWKKFKNIFVSFYNFTGNFDVNKQIDKAAPAVVGWEWGKIKNIFKKIISPKGLFSSSKKDE